MLDQKIIQLIRTGKSDKALDGLYKHFPMIRKMVRTHGGDVRDAEDVFQDALVILCRKIENPDFTLTSRLSTYLYGVCRYLWKDELRRRKRAIPPDLADTEEAAATAVEEELTIKLAEKVLLELGDRCRELLGLFYEAGLQLKDIASRMGYSSENTAKTQKYKCLENARNTLRTLQQTLQTL